MAYGSHGKKEKRKRKIRCSSRKMGSSAIECNLKNAATAELKNKDLING